MCMNIEAHIKCDVYAQSDPMPNPQPRTPKNGQDILTTATTRIFQVVTLVTAATTTIMCQVVTFITVAWLYAYNTYCITMAPKNMGPLNW